MNILFYVIAGIVFAIIILVLLIFASYIYIFYGVECQHCGHSMEYRGEKEDREGDRFIFQCPKCGEYEEIPVKEFRKRLTSFYYE